MIFNLVLRSLRRRAFLNAIKLVGLVLAFSSLMLIGLYLKHELSFDRFHEKSERIFRFTASSPSAFQGKHFARIWGAAYIPELAESFPEVEKYVRLSPVAGGLIQWEEKKIPMQQAFLCDSTFLEIFDVPLLMGDPARVLQGPSSMLISESYARRIFGNENPVGQILTIPSGRYYGEETHFTVKGIMADFPGNSHIHPEFVATAPEPGYLDGWAWVYLLLRPGSKGEGIIAGYPDFLAEYRGLDPEEVDMAAHLQSIEDIHLRSRKTREIEANSNMAVVYSFSIAVLILLFIALVNYSNLNMGMLRYSDNFTYLSRVFGASRTEQLKYYTIEGILIIALVALLGILSVVLAATYIHSRFDLKLLEENFFFILLSSLVICLLAFLAGFIPQLRAYIASRGKKRRKSLSRGLIVIQYAIAIILLVAVITIQRQTSLAMSSAMGAGNTGIICLKHTHSSIVERFPEYKKSLLNYPSIRHVSGMLDPPGGEANDMFRFEMAGYEPGEENEDNQHIGILPCDYSLPALFDLDFLAGRDFSEAFTDPEGSGEYIVNRAALERLGVNNPADLVDREFQLFFHNDFIQIPAGRIIGVVEDFHLSSLKRPIEPLVMFKRDSMWVDNLLISFSPGNIEKGMKDAEMVWKELFPGHDFNYEFVDEMYHKLYLAERLQAALLLLFTIIALFICSMGLLGLALLATEQRIKEIGIRRVNGAGIPGIVWMLNREFLQWVMLAVIFALPLSWFAMQRWMEAFVYRIDLSWWIFALAAIIALLISGITISFQSLRSARRNPVEALRYE